MRILLELAILVILALLASSRRFWTFRRTRAGTALFSGGWFLVLVGMLLGPSGVGMVRAEQISLHHPLMVVCLGWIGLIVGFQADRRLPKLLPARVTWTAIFDGALSLLVTTAAAVAVLSWQLEISPWSALPPSLLLGVCAMSWSPEIRSLKQNPHLRLHTTTFIRGGAGIGSILMVLAYALLINAYHVDSTADTISLWSPQQFLVGVLAPILLAIAMGFFGSWLMQLTERSEGHFLVVLLGIICFTAGAAALMDHLPLFVTLLLGAILTNLPGAALIKFKRAVIEGEQPIAMILMLAVGVMADPSILFEEAYLAMALIGMLVATRVVLKLGVLQAVIRMEVHRSISTPSLRGLLRPNALAIAIAAGFSISALGRSAAIPLNASQLLMIILTAGFLCDVGSLVLTRRATVVGRSQEVAP